MLSEKLQRGEAGDAGEVQLTEGLECHAKEHRLIPLALKVS